MSSFHHSNLPYRDLAAKPSGLSRIKSKVVDVIKDVRGLSEAASIDRLLTRHIYVSRHSGAGRDSQP
jgi:hypothetical protein